MRTFEPIAIVGRSCVLPGALDPQALWQAVASGQDLTSRAPEGRWGLHRDHAVSAIQGTAKAAEFQDRTWSDRGGYVRGFDDLFDPEGLGLPTSDVMALDPLFQWVLHAGRAAWNDAGLGSYGGRGAVVLGNLSFPSARTNRFAESVWLHRAGLEHPGAPSTDPRNRFMSGLPAHLLARALGLEGGALALDAACASSLYAIALACERLHDRRADAVLAGAVSCADDLFIHIGFCALDALSKSGRSRPFHRQADGLLPAEGAAFVVLERLSDALTRRRKILGVIRGVGLSNDGRGRGLLVPSEEGQQRALVSAYAGAGLAPKDISLVECHATGTPVGDATELRSLGTLYAGLEGVPIGSLKSNLGHLVTTAGLAGLLKILGAMEHGLRPPTLHVEDPNPALAGSPFRLLEAAEPWPDDVPRRAALSAFGFGGNNAHLLVEEWRTDRPHSIALPQVPPSAPKAPVVVVSLAVIAADGQGVDDFSRHLFSEESRLQERPTGPAGLTGPIELPLAALSSPPRDLEQTLPQQLLLMRAAQQAVEPHLHDLDRSRTGVWIGMGCDAEIARYGLRWRLGEWSASWQATPSWTAAARQAAVPGLLAAGVLGTMPNMTANRLNRQYDFGGPSASVSAEELSGVRALEMAARAVAAGDLDAAVVGAVDLSCEPAHEAAARALLPSDRHLPGDAAVVMVLMRQDEAFRRGLPVLAVLDRGEESPTLRFRLTEAEETEATEATPGHTLTPRFGHAHAASGLLHVAAATLALHHRSHPGLAAETPPRPCLGPTRAAVEVSALGGERATVHLRAGTATPAGLEPAAGFPRVHLFAGDDRGAVLAALGRGVDRETSSDCGPARLALVARCEEELAARRRQAAEWLRDGGTQPREVWFREQPLQGELAFVFTGAAAAYAGMGRELLLALPRLGDHLRSRVADPEALAGWVYHTPPPPPRLLDQLWGSSMLCQAHAELTRGILGLEPDAVLGISSGESNALMAFGVWRDLDGLFRDTVEGNLFSHQLAGDFAAVARAWGTSAVHWENWVLRAAPDAVRTALEAEPRVHLTLVHTFQEVVIGGDAAGCRRVIESLGATAHPLGYPMAVHCPELSQVQEEWLELHRREPGPPPAARFYTHADGGRSYKPMRESSAQAILGQAVDTVDFPALLNLAWDDGVRIFLEHGPRGLCSRWIRHNLRHRGVDDDSWLAVPLDRSGAPLDQAAQAIAQLLAAGVDLDFRAFAPAPGLKPLKTPGLALTFESHWPPVILPPLELRSAAPAPEPRISTVNEHPAQPQVMAPAPRLPSVFDDSIPTPAVVATPAAKPKVPSPVMAPSATPPSKPQVPSARPLFTPPPQVAAAPPPASGTATSTATGTATGIDPILAGLANLHGQIARSQSQYLQTQHDLHQRFLALQQQNLEHLATAWAVPAPSLATAGSGPASPSQVVGAVPAPPALSIAAPSATTSGVPAPSVPAPSVPAPSVPAPSVPAPRATASNSPAQEQRVEAAQRLPGPKFDRGQLEVLASGKISSVFGALFEKQDGYARQVRMPEPPFLLADRVTGIDAEPGSMGTGTIWTETDVKEDSWYLHQGRMPGGLMIEAGQADLLLISWLGADFLNKSERIYRLLGCELTYRGELPKPGDTLCYDIHIDAHAKQGDVRLFFFHYDCHVDGGPRLQVRHGQAGFFTDQELADSGGLLWNAASAELPPARQLDPPDVACTHRRFSNAQMTAFSTGRVYECFGPGFEFAAAHTMSPRIQDGRMMLLREVLDFDPAGGPWGRGYLRADTPIRSEDWLFEGHFKNDPCMPGTVMFEGCLQAMAFYLTACGYTLERDGWRFEPVPDIAYKMRCRGQVTPSSEHLVYEVFVREVFAGPVPTLYADLLCTVDGLKAFHAEGVGLRLVPDWPLQVDPSLAEQPFPGGEPPLGRPVASVPQSDGSRFHFDYASLLACAWGQPSTAFGEMYLPFDGPRSVARLPGPPYHFMSRVCKIDGEMGRFQPGATIETEYDIPPGAWYFQDNGYPTMPYAVLLEAGLQPCGWLASFVGSALTDNQDLQFRNLDGTATLHKELLPKGGTVENRIQLYATSNAGGVIILRFRVEMRLQGELAFDMDTAFGFFPKAAMANQVGLPPSAEERARFESPGDLVADLTARPPRYCAGSLRLAEPSLLMLDRVTVYDPEGGSKGLGYMRAEKDVDPSEWFFKAHFFQDPVQPGSLGIEALLQLLQFYMLHLDLGADIPNPRFESIGTARPLTWKYRGQVMPTNRLISADLDVKEVGRDADGAVYALADACLWVDGKRIYSTVDLGMRIVPGDGATAQVEDLAAGEEVLDPAHDTWLADHCPTWTLPALPMMSMVDRLAAAAHAQHPQMVVTGLEDVRVLRWIAFPDGPVRLATEVVSAAPRDDGWAIEVNLQVWRAAPRAELSRFETAATGTVLLAPAWSEPPAPLRPLDDAPLAEDPYATGTLFHGPAFQLLRQLRLGNSGSSVVLDADSSAVPHGILHQALLDAATHGIPHDALHRWSQEIPEGVAAYPRALPTATFFGPPPTAGTVRCEARYLGEPDTPRTRIQLIAGENVWAELELEEVLLPKGPIGRAAPAARRAFLTAGQPADGLGLSHFDGTVSRLNPIELAASDWLPGTVGRIYHSDESERGALTRLVAMKDHAARQAAVHPASVEITNTESGEHLATAARYPATRFPLTVEEEAGSVVVSNAGPPRLVVEPIRQYWRNYLNTGPWPGEDLYYSLIKRFVRRIVVEDPEALAAHYGRPILFLGNHQVMLESLLFSTISSGLCGLPVITLAKAEHKTTWLGRFILHCFAYPGLEDPDLIAFFDRENLRSLPIIIRELGKKMAGGSRSVTVHCEGTRSLTCRQPVKNLSGSFVDMALKQNIPIVPVRFVGGLPAEPLEERIDFPLGCGQQDYWLGKPMLAEDLEKLRYRERREAVIEAINQLGPSNAEEEPLPPNPEFEAAAQEWQERSAALAPHAVIYETLRRMNDPGPEARQWLQAVEDSELRLADDPKGRWLAEVAGWLYGPQGPRVRVG